ncbi:alpha/beta hydrolase [Mycobacterium sp. SM1]|uniref:alpha/beta fold hydrolase n=1 Tax=Mycobacterium sp. SM1 TaxID=2816243 RepID=UPI001BCB6ABD|nr:alpha/beta hydrolase [Mycobacterium sp. SM1]MBS4730408.1 alpha/beta hydrolase [Mycobacterium sp. SM1]
MTIRRPEDFKHYEAKLPEVRVHYVREGSGPPLVLLHGWPGFWWEWSKVIGPLAENYDVIVPDLRGFGDSEKPDLADLAKYALERTTDDQAFLLDSLGIDKAYIVGHDYGGIVVHKFIRKYRDRVIKAAIFDPITPDFGPFYLGFPHIAESWYSQFHQTDMSVKLVTLNRDTCRIYFKHFFDHWSYQAPLLTDEEMEIHVDNCMKPDNVHGGFNYYRANLSVNSNPWTALDQTVSDLPVTMLWGVGDPVVPSTLVDQVPKYYSNYTMELIEDGGHFLMVEKPNVVIARLKDAFR